ncbi:MAG: diaminopimelate epimerase [Paludibacteraceae bacterium]|nr:diaminopimelate epimerase [Paludibacteraceae bacterium]
MKQLLFTKMHGAGNDYIYIDCFRQNINNPSALSVRLSNRHTGIGSDGLVLIMPSERADLKMRMFNADGSEAEMCGNASRCIGKYAYEHGLVKKTDLTLETLAGIKHLQLHLTGNIVDHVTVNMGKAHLCGKTEYKGEEIVCADVGNPHAIIFVNDTETYSVKSVGPLIEHLPCFPEKTNVEFAQVLNPGEINLRVWERGTGETLACGTGACATAFAAYMVKNTLPRLIIHLPGGDLNICINPDTGELLMTGPAEEVFSGIIQI